MTWRKSILRGCAILKFENEFGKLFRELKIKVENLHIQLFQSKTTIIYRALKRDICKNLRKIIKFYFSRARNKRRNDARRLLRRPSHEPQKAQRRVFGATWLIKRAMSNSVKLLSIQDNSSAFQHCSHFCSELPSTTFLST